ncbi:MAG: IS66 family transposase [Streptosporangiaceae bacterium]
MIEPVVQIKQARRAGAGRGARAGNPHPGERLVCLRALASRRAESIIALLAFFTGFLITDGYTAYQQLLPQLAGIQQCVQHYSDIAVMPMTDADPCCEGEFLMAVSA